MANKNMTLTEIEKAPKNFKDTHTVSVGGFRDGGRVTNHDLLNAINKLNNKVDNLEKRINEVETSLSKRIIEVEANLTKRIDNLVVKNNLNE